MNISHCIRCQFMIPICQVSEKASLTCRYYYYIYIFYSRLTILNLKVLLKTKRKITAFVQNLTKFIAKRYT